MIGDKELNTLGLRCPEPIMLVRKAIRELSVGQILHVVADDLATTRDIIFNELLMNYFDKSMFLK